MTLTNFRKIEVLVATDGLKKLECNVTKSKDKYLKEGWVVQKILHKKSTQTLCIKASR